MEKKSIRVNRTNNGTPSLWENYREFENVKRSVTVFDNNGDRLEHIFTKYDNSALVPIREGYYILKIFSDMDGKGITLLKVNEVDRYSNNCVVSVVKRMIPGTNTWVDYIEIEDDVFNKINEIIKFTII
jgi:cytolysin (calcineurin-like family phosphatase)